MIKRQPWVDLESAFDLKQKQPGIVRVTPSASLARLGGTEAVLKCFDDEQP